MPAMSDRVRVWHCIHDGGYPRRKEHIRTGSSPAGVSTRFQGDDGRSAGCRIASIANRHDFRVRTARRLCMSLANNSPVSINNDSSYRRIWAGGPLGFPPELGSPIHGVLDSAHRMPADHLTAGWRRLVHYL